MGKPYMWMLIHKAMAIAGDMGLDRPMPSATTKSIRGISLGWAPRDSQTAVNTVEETRAVLGCYVICSV